jgi:flagella basal body P-ring formation protein FlgA
MNRLTAIFIPIAAATSLHAAELRDILTPLASLPANVGSSSLSTTASQQDAPAVVTSRGDYTLGDAQILDALQSELTARLTLRGELKLSFVEPWNPIEIKNGKDWSLVVDGIPKSGISANFPARFTVMAGGKKVGVWELPVKAKLIEPVWISTRRLERGESINSGGAALLDSDVLSTNKELLKADEKLDYFEIAQAVPANQILSRSDITPRQIVRRGKVVDVIVKEGGINISMKAMALADGGVGQTIGVRNIDSKKDFQAQVVGSNTVQVKF